MEDGIKRNYVVTEDNKFQINKVKIVWIILKGSKAKICDKFGCVR